MSAQFQVDTERIQAASSDVARIGAEIEGQVGAMMGRLHALEDAWRGSAASRFQAVVAEWQGTQRHVKESLDHIAQLLAHAGSTYAETEAAAERMFA